MGARRIRYDILVGGCFLLMGVAFVLFMDALVAPPKLLFGRSLTAITPSLFPKIVLGLLAFLSAAFLILALRDGEQGDPLPSRGATIRVGALFLIMLGYSVLMQPLGFLISTILAVSLTSVLAGNRHYFQVAVISVVAPVLLYLCATRLLAVSLPELSSIEFFYARFFDMIGMGQHAVPAAGGGAEAVPGVSGTETVPGVSGAEAGQ